MFIALGSKIQPLTVLLALALLGTLIVSAFRISRMAPHYGRRRVVWFFISLFFTAIPATLVFWRDYARSMSARDSLPGLGRRLKKTRGAPSEDPPARCPHCGEFFPPADDNGENNGDGVDRDVIGNNDNGGSRSVIEKCPNCKMELDGKHFA